MKKISFNDHWTCKKQGDSAEPKAVTLPHDAMLLRSGTERPLQPEPVDIFPAVSMSTPNAFFSRKRSAAVRIFWNLRRSIKTRRCM